MKPEPYGWENIMSGPHIEVGDRVEFLPYRGWLPGSSATLRAMESGQPLIVTEVKGDRCRLNTGSKAWYSFKRFTIVRPYELDEEMFILS